MTALPTSNYISDNARTEGEHKQYLEDLRSAIEEHLGGKADSTLTIAAGAITPTAAIHKVDTEGAAGVDDLTVIDQTNHPDGRLLLLRAADAGRVVTVKHNAGGVGQITLLAAADLNLNTAKWLLLKRSGTLWEQVLRGPGETWPNADQVDGYHAGNSAGQVTVSNGALCTNLNADQVDGYHAGNSAGQVTVSNGALCTNLNADQVDGKDLTQISPMASSTAPAVSTAFDVASSIGAAWESVGPTGSGATNPWAALDSVPSDVAWIEVLVSNFAQNTGGSEAQQAIYARANGSAVSIGNDANISESYVNIGGATSVGARHQTTARIPVSSRKFDLYRATIGTTYIGQLALVGWGY